MLQCLQDRTGYFTVLEYKFAGVRSSHTEFVEFRTRAEAFKRFFDYKRRNSVLLFVSIRIRSGVHLEIQHIAMRRSLKILARIKIKI